MTPDFFDKYIDKYQSEHKSLKKILYVCNPNKFIAAEYLLREHEKKGDKIIVFSDLTFPLVWMAEYMKRPFIKGDMNEQEKLNILAYF
jgi:DNA excision repair protein ERCC-3